MLNKATSRRLQAAAELPVLSRVEFAMWTCTIAIAQFMWGLWSVCNRWMQTQPPVPAKPLQLALMINVIAYPCIMLVSTAPRKLLAWLHAHRQQREKLANTRSGQQHGCTRKVQIDLASAPGSAAAPVVQAVAADVETCMQEASRGSCTCRSSDGQAGVGTHISTGSHGPCHEQQQDHQEKQQGPAPWQQRLQRRLYPIAVASGVGTFMALYNITEIASLKFTSPYLVQLVFIFQPLFTAIASSILFKQARPKGLWITLLCSIGGSGMVIGGQWSDSTGQFSGSPEGASNAATGHSPIASMFIGLSFAVASMLLLTGFLLALQLTKHIVTGEQVLVGNRNMTLLLCLPLAFAVDGTDWTWLYRLRPQDWGVLMFAIIVIFTLNNLASNYCVQKLGATMMSVFSPMQLIAAVTGSVALLHADVPRSALTWAGLAVVFVTITAFLVLQQYLQQKQHDERHPAPEKQTSVHVNHDTGSSTNHSGNTGVSAGISHS